MAQRQRGGIGDQPNVVLAGLESVAARVPSDGPPATPVLSLRSAERGAASGFVPAAPATVRGSFSPSQSTPLVGLTTASRAGRAFCSATASFNPALIILSSAGRSITFSNWMSSSGASVGWVEQPVHFHSVPISSALDVAMPAVRVDHRRVRESNGKQDPLVRIPRIMCVEINDESVAGHGRFQKK